MLSLIKLRMISLPSHHAGIRVLCPTHWTVRAQALSSIAENYEVLEITLEDSIRETRDVEM